jgi:TldD protein
VKALIAGAAAIAGIVSLLAAQVPVPGDDPVLRAMSDELERSRALRVTDLDKPYFIEYSLEDADVWSATASLGGLIRSQRNRARIPQVNVRVGSYEFDNTGHVYSTYGGGARFDAEQWPLDDDYTALRQSFWLATDRAYKNALEAIARKRASLKNVAQPESIPDFAKTDPVQKVLPAKLTAYDERPWIERTVNLSRVFTAYPELFGSAVNMQIFQGIDYYANSEGTRERSLDNLVQIEARLGSQAADGMPVHDAVTVAALDMNGLPGDAELRKLLAQSAENVRALRVAPVGESYSGPVLFDGAASAQLVAQLIGDNLRVPRRPVSDPGRPAPFLPSDFETRLGARVLPEWIDVVDDPTQREWQGHRLIGEYGFDLEGVPPQPVVAVEKGILKSFLMTRQPLRNASGSNGHARLAGAYGARGAAISNLFVKAAEAKPAAQLRAQLIELCKQQNKPYGIVIRKLDYPASGSFREMQNIFAGAAQGGGGSRPVSPPLLAYRLYPDGREELVRGLRFRGLNSRALRDILAASQETYVFDFVNNGAPFAMMGAGGFLAPTSVVAPALLFDEIELERSQDELSRPPIVPPPPLDDVAK